MIPVLQSPSFSGAGNPSQTTGTFDGQVSHHGYVRRDTTVQQFASQPYRLPQNGEDIVAGPPVGGVLPESTRRPTMFLLMANAGANGDRAEPNGHSIYYNSPQPLPPPQPLLQRRPTQVNGFGDPGTVSNFMVHGPEALPSGVPSDYHSLGPVITQGAFDMYNGHGPPSTQSYSAPTSIAPQIGTYTGVPEVRVAYPQAGNGTPYLGHPQRQASSLAQALILDTTRATHSANEPHVHEPVAGYPHLHESQMRRMVGLIPSDVPPCVHQAHMRLFARTR